MQTSFMLLSLVAAGLAAGFLRVGVKPWLGGSLAVIVGWAVIGEVSGVVAAVAALFLVAIGAPLVHEPWRRQFVTAPVLKMYERLAPKLSDTEAVALEAGTVGWEGELFAGKPDFRKLLSQPKPELSAAERAFLDGPVEELCTMLDDWEITHKLSDLPQAAWDHLGKHRFFGMIIPKRYGGLEFSALGHAKVLEKLASKSVTASSTVAVPNSLGPAELLLHYGTEDQKDHYLPRLACGEEIPCFGLTGPTAGSDATSIPDVGIIEKGIYQGEEVLGIRLTFDKRYITLAPVATVIGLAFRLRDPDGLIGDKEDVGISLALIPRDTPGVEIGARHNPLDIPFMNGPIRGTDVFVPVDFLIGGTAMAGQGWRMLVECLSVGRAISLPSSSSGGMRAMTLATGAYARIRKQFNLPIGRFEGIEEALARIGGYTYAATALSEATAAAVDRGEKPAVSSAISKYHATELARAACKDAVDIHGGKAIILGPRNYLGRGWQGSPIAITVEGANIMTRSLMIFGQGAIRCHPFVLEEMAALKVEDRSERLKRFDRALFGHIGVALSNACRSLLFGIGVGRLQTTPAGPKTARYYRTLRRYSAALGFTADLAMLLLGGKLKFKERLSARLGDVLSQLYILSAILKRFEDQGRPSADLPFLRWAAEDSANKMQTALDEFIRNFPVRPAAWLMRVVVFPFGKWDIGPNDRDGHRVATLLLAPSEARDRLTTGIFTADLPNHPLGRLHAALPDVIKAEPLERKLAKAIRHGELDGESEAGEVLKAAVEQGIINDQDRALIERTREAIADIIAVDEFDPSELVRAAEKPAAPRGIKAA